MRWVWAASSGAWRRKAVLRAQGRGLVGFKRRQVGFGVAFGGDRVFGGGGGEAELSERAGVVAAEVHFEIDGLAGGNRLFEDEDGDVSFADALGDGPAGLDVAVGGEFGGDGVVAEPVFGVGLGGAGDLCSGDFEFGEVEVAFAPLVKGGAGPLSGRRSSGRASRRRAAMGLSEGGKVRV